MAKYLVRFTFDTFYFDLMLDGSTKIQKNFTLAELANTKGSSKIPQYEVTDKTRTFMKGLQKLRDIHGSLTINSNYRQSSFNKSVGGDPKSAHLHGWAADIKRPNQTTAKRKAFATDWENICKELGVVGAINYYTGGYHVEMYSDICYGNKKFVIRDYRGTKSDW